MRYYSAMQNAIQHQKPKRHRSMRWRLDVIQTRNYDTDYAVQSIGGLNYTVDTQGNIKSISDAAGGNGFDYDNLDRLTKVKNSSTLADVTAFTYDATGNRLSKKVGTAAVVNNTYPTTNHRLTNVGTVARTLDANGNTTQSAAAKFLTYDARNRLVDFRTGSAATTIVSQYQFNAKGERVRKYKGTVDQSRYLYSEGGQLLVQNRIVSGVTTTQEIIWLDDMPIGVNQGGTLHGILTDHLNSPRAVFQLNNQVKVWRWDAVDDAFGEKLAVEDPDANSVLFKFDMRFPGQMFDSESGLHYNLNRDYSPPDGRYIESDPIGLSGGVSSYGYAIQNPVRLFDRDGLTAEDVARVNVQMNIAFPELNQRGSLSCGNLPAGKYGTTTPWSGDITVAQKYCQKKCLSRDEWEELFFTLFHEGMHSTDSRWLSLRQSSSDRQRWHDGIFNRELYEGDRAAGIPMRLIRRIYGGKPIWGTPRSSPIDLDSLYEQYKSGSSDCCKG
jgi:RHS repeat-associated protein